MSKTFKVEAVVLKRKNFGEADKILTFFGKQSGKIRVIAKGIRRIHSKKAPHLEVFNLVSGFIVKGKTWDIITEVETVENFTVLRSTLGRIAYAYHVVELSDRLFPEEEEHEDIYHLLVATLRKLNDPDFKDIPGLINSFSHALLWSLGYLPKNKIITAENLIRFVENIMEGSLKSESLLTRLLDR